MDMSLKCIKYINLSSVSLPLYSVLSGLGSMLITPPSHMSHCRLYRPCRFLCCVLFCSSPVLFFSFRYASLTHSKSFPLSCLVLFSLFDYLPVFSLLLLSSPSLSSS